MNQRSDKSSLTVVLVPGELGHLFIFLSLTHVTSSAYFPPSPSFSVCLIFNYILGFCIQVSQIPCRHTDRSCIVSDTTPAGQLHWSCTSFPVEFIQHVCFCECERAKDISVVVQSLPVLCFCAVCVWQCYLGQKRWRILILVQKKQVGQHIYLYKIFNILCLQILIFSHRIGESAEVFLLLNRLNTLTCLYTVLTFDFSVSFLKLRYINEHCGLKGVFGVIVVFICIVSLLDSIDDHLGSIKPSWSMCISFKSV